MMGGYSGKLKPHRSIVQDIVNVMISLVVQSFNISMFNDLISSPTFNEAFLNECQIIGLCRRAIP
jgi:hypothetical protein